MRREQIALMLGLLLTAGCLEDPDPHCPRCDTVPPLPPVGVISVTGDQAVYLEWYPNQESDLDGYRVYVSREPHGPYTLLGFTTDITYEHQASGNGVTYYYGVSALDYTGNESELNDEIVYDTPRPEGFGLSLYEADGDQANRSGYDFSRFRRFYWDDDRTDIFYDWYEDVPYLAVPDYATDIQDAGFAGFDDVTWAPDGGWSASGYVEAIPGHVYVIWTRDDHFAKARVVEVEFGRLIIDWAYQEDKGNPELLPQRRSGPRPRLSSAEEDAS